ncbi:hypothetical protein Dimus_035732 [Dionaea muscipula]
MTKRRKLQLPVEAFVRGRKGKKGSGGRDRRGSPDRVRVDPRGHDDRGRKDYYDVDDRYPDPPATESIKGKEVAGGRESAIPVGGSARGSSSSVTPIAYAKERFKYESIGGRREELDSNGNLLPHGFHYVGPQPKVSGLPFPKKGFICCEANALSFSQAVSSAYPVDKLVYRHEPGGRMTD